MERYAAKLLFQWRVLRSGKVAMRRLCEERTVLVEARSRATAIAKARRRGRKGEYRMRNMSGDPVSFECVGIIDMLRLGAECRPDEVWYDVRSVHRPLEPDSRPRSRRLEARIEQWPPIQWFERAGAGRSTFSSLARDMGLEARLLKQAQAGNEAAQCRLAERLMKQDTRRAYRSAMPWLRRAAGDDPWAAITWG